MIRIRILLYLIFAFSYKTNAQVEVEDYPVAEKPDRYQIDINKYTGDKVHYFYMFDPAPEFPGGYKAFNAYINDKIIIEDKKAKEINLIVTYIVEPDGTVSNVEFLENPKPEIRDQIIKIMQSAPKFNPGKRDGKPARALFERTPLTILIP